MSSRTADRVLTPGARQPLSPLRAATSPSSIQPDLALTLPVPSSASRFDPSINLAFSQAPQGVSDVRSINAEQVQNSHCAETLYRLDDYFFGD